MKYQVALVTVAVIAALSIVGYKHCQRHQHKDMTEAEVRKLWVEWRNEHRKAYLFGEEMNRYEIFKANNKIIEDSNNAVPKKSYRLAHNQFSDLTKAEYKALYLTLKPRKERKLNVEAHLQNVDVSTLPTSVDWRTQGAVNKVKNQGSCGSCWAFSAVAAMEGAYFLKHGELLSFSEQQLLNCDHVDQACNGGLMDNAFTYAESHKMVTESELPYKAKKSRKCKVSKMTGYAEVTSFHDVTPKSEAALQAAIAQQPVSIAVEADQSSFQFYSSGVMTSKCGAQLDHGVAAVGYGTDAASGHDYWLVRNSWGSSWGDAGYIKLARGGRYAKLNSGAGQCGLLGQPSYPKVE